MKAIYDKVDVLQHTASNYEKLCLRLYWHLTYNWTHAPEVKSFRVTDRLVALLGLETLKEKQDAEKRSAEIESKLAKNEPLLR